MASDGYRGLLVWQKAMDLVESSYRMTHSFPECERFGLSSQIQRAAVSIPANLAEGHSRGGTREFLYFVRIACGSIAELETHIEVARRLNYLSAMRFAELNRQAEEVGRMLSGLRASLQKKLSQKP
ncbi:MAG: four helix bundle protein [Planctomycetales bacterium]